MSKSEIEAKIKELEGIKWNMQLQGLYGTREYDKLTAELTLMYAKLREVE